MTVPMLRGLRVGISAKRKLCQVVDESTLPVVVEAVAGEQGGRNPAGPVLRRNLRNGRRNGNVVRSTGRRRGAKLLVKAVRLPVKMVWTVLKFMCIYTDRPVEVIQEDVVDDVTRIWFRINPTFEDRSYLMVQDSVRFGLLM